ncbi:hypothetical protein ACIQUM_30960 [Amycolatopsis azurea]|uniref:hypothetical protein n=1 Tax=Amycolatopsis azurea TaxID=36819 RepID=UPI0038121B15
MYDERPVELAPQSVAELAVDPGWKVTRAGTTGHWLTAERVIEREGGNWLIGLTPVRPGVVALILWFDGEVVENLRDTEAETCATAYRWVKQFLSGNR